MFLASFFHTKPHYVSYLVFTITAKFDRKPSIVMNRSCGFHSSLNWVKCTSTKFMK